MGTGRGAGSHEVGTFNIHDTSSTKSEWDEVVWELPRCGRPTTTRSRASTSRSTCRTTSCRSPTGVASADVGRVRQPADVREGGHARHRRARLQLHHHPRDEADDRRVQAGHRRVRRPVGELHQRQRDDHQRGALLRGRQQGARARRDPDRGYLFSLVHLYHDTFPKPDGRRCGPSRRSSSTAKASSVSSRWAGCCAVRPTKCSSSCSLRADRRRPGQLRFPGHLSHDDALECIEPFGKYVIPEFDKDPVHSTTRYRDSAF